jgi:RNA polymerase sigma-70 factor, ECF subfamily
VWHRWSKPAPTQVSSVEGPKELVSVTAAVDRTTLDRLVRHHLTAAHRLALRLLGPGQAQAAEEVVTEALYRAARGWQSFRGGADPAAFRAWFNRIVVNAFRDHLAHRAQTGPEATVEPADPRVDDPAAVAAAGELGELVARQVSNLPSRQREVLVLIVYEGHDAAEVANMLNLTEPNVRTTLHLARQKLRERLARHLPDEYADGPELSREKHRERP